MVAAEVTHNLHVPNHALEQYSDSLARQLPGVNEWLSNLYSAKRVCEFCTESAMIERKFLNKMSARSTPAIERWVRDVTIFIPK